MNRKKYKAHKAIVRDYLHEHYTTTNLLDLIDSARSGVFSFYSCCCLVGLPTRDHDVQPSKEYAGTCWWMFVPHYQWVRTQGAAEAEHSASILARYKTDLSGQQINQRFRNILLPMAKAELKRRQPQIQKTLPVDLPEPVSENEH